MYLATPNWPDGMNPSSSVSWIVYIPKEYKAELLFSNVSKPKCDSGHTEVSIGPLDSRGQTQSWREDQSFPSPVVQQQSFYLNMSNCEPKSDRFAVLSKISLQKETSKTKAFTSNLVFNFFCLFIHHSLYCFVIITVKYNTSCCFSFLHREHPGHYLGYSRSAAVFGNHHSSSRVRHSKVSLNFLWYMLQTFSFLFFCNKWI